MSFMDLTEFHAARKQLTADDIHDVARSLASDTAGDEVDAWHATIAIDTLRKPTVTIASCHGRPP